MATPANLRYVVTGCAGSGTRWASMLLSLLGSACGHQTVYRVDGVHTKGRYLRRLRGDSSFFAAPYTHTLPVLRVMRDPLKVVRSLDQMNGFLADDGTGDDALTTAYITRHLPDVAGAPDRLGRLIRYVTNWDAIIAATGEIRTLRVDQADRPEIADLAWHFAGVEVTRQQLDPAVNRAGDFANSHGGPSSTIEWPQIDDHPDGHLLTAKARKWGYL